MQVNHPVGPQHLRVLRVLACTAPLTAHTLGRGLGISANHAAVLLCKMRRRGLVARGTATALQRHTRRNVRLAWTLTAAGRVTISVPLDAWRPAEHLCAVGDMVARVLREPALLDMNQGEPVTLGTLLPNTVRAELLFDIWEGELLRTPTDCKDWAALNGIGHASFDAHVAFLTRLGLVTLLGEVPVLAQGVAEAQVRRAYTAMAGVRACRVCGCSDAWGCEEGCWWTGPELCSSCQGVRV